MGTQNSTDQPEISLELPILANVDDQARQLACQTNQEPAAGNTVLRKGMDRVDFKAAEEGNFDALKKHGEQLQTLLTATKNTVLHIYIACSSRRRAFKNEEPDFVQKILEMCPALLLQKNESGETALHVAARHGRADIVRVLIKAAEPRDNIDPEQGRPSSDDCKRLIITTNNDENTALYEAVRSKSLDAVRILIQKDPEFSYPANIAGETPLYLAAERGYRDIVFEILDTCKSLVYTGPNGRTALHAAVILDHKEMSEKLLQKDKALAKAADEKGYTPLHLAADFGHLSIVKVLLECDASVAYVGTKDDKMTALHLAAKKGHLGVMKQLISVCPDCCEVVDHKSQNALHYALQKQHYDILKFVLEKPWLSNILLNGKDVDGNTFYHQFAASPEGFILRGFESDANVDTMAFNNKNLNAHDILLANWHNISTGLSRVILKKHFQNSGVGPGHRIKIHKDSGNKETGNHVGSEDSGKSPTKAKEPHKESGNKETGNHVGSEDSGDPTQAKETHMIVATLIATVTFAAGIAMPGGYEKKGFAVLSRHAAFRVFVITNTIAMAMSSCSVLVLLYSSLHTKRKYENQLSDAFTMVVSLTMLSLILVVVAFISGTYAVLGGGHSSGLAVAACVIGGFSFFVLTSHLLSTEKQILEAPDYLVDIIGGFYFLGVKLYVDAKEVWNCLIKRISKVQDRVKSRS